MIDEDSDIYKVIKLINAFSALLKNSSAFKNNSETDLLFRTASSVLKWEMKNYINESDTLNASQQNFSSDEELLNEKNYNKSSKNEFKMSLQC